MCLNNHIQRTYISNIYLHTRAWVRAVLACLKYRVGLTLLKSTKAFHLRNDCACAREPRCDNTYYFVLGALCRRCNEVKQVVPKSNMLLLPPLPQQPPMLRATAAAAVSITSRTAPASKIAAVAGIPILARAKEVKEERLEMVLPKSVHLLPSLLLSILTRHSAGTGSMFIKYAQV